VFVPAGLLYLTASSDISDDSILLIDVVDVVLCKDMA
jgi:hypothetical protein